MRLCVRESESKGVPSDYETHPLPKLLVCFHGEVESALKKRLHPIIRDGGCSAWHGSDDEPYSPCSSFPWQWLNEILVMEGWAQTGRRVTDAFHIFIFLPSASVSDLYLSLSSDHKAVIIIMIDVILYANSSFFFLFFKVSWKWFNSQSQSQAHKWHAGIVKCIKGKIASLNIGMDERHKAFIWKWALISGFKRMSNPSFWPSSSKCFSLYCSVWLKELRLVHTLKGLNYRCLITVVI